MPKVPPSIFGYVYKHAGKLRYINHYGNIRTATVWQRIKDKIRGRLAALRKWQLFDGAYDHSMHYYYTYISRMDDTGNQPPK